VLACHSIDDLRLAARRVLPRMVFDFADGGAQSESTLHANRAAFERYRLLASGPKDVHSRSTATRLFGAEVKMPLIIGPTGYAGIFWPQGDVALARSAARFGIPFVISHGANVPLEIIAKDGGGRLWLQIYLASLRDRSLQLIRRAQELGFEALEVTVDTAIPGRRLRDIRNGFGMPLTWTPTKLVDVLGHPGWLLRTLRHGIPTPGLMEASGGKKWATISDFARAQINPAITWEDLKWLRDQWKGILIVKGLLDPEEMPQALAAGYDGVVVSNHGGRQLDGAVSTIDMLCEFVTAAAGRISVLIDSGFRSGTDILRALALGAAGVQVGRPTLYGLAVAGEAGVDRALSIFGQELDIAMALTGLTRPDQATPRLVRVISGPGGLS